MLPGLPLIAGGKSFGGRMTSQAQAAAPLEGVRGLAFLGFPLHPAGKPSSDRAKHLADVHVPMLFLQGTRDKLSRNWPLLEPVVQRLGPWPRCIWSTGADHSFHVLARSGRKDREVMGEILDVFADRWGDSGPGHDEMRPASAPSADAMDLPVQRLILVLHLLERLHRFRILAAPTSGFRLAASSAS